MNRQQLQGISEFLLVVDKGSFTAAAESLEMTRSRVSQIISKLERQLGVQLMLRSTRSIALTEVGQHFYKECSGGLRQVYKAIDQAQKEQIAMRGKIRVNSLGGLYGEEILAPMILRFMARYPEIAVDLAFASEHVDLVENHYDFAVRMGKLPDSSLLIRKLAAYNVYLCASPGYLENHGMPEHPKDLLDHKTVAGSVNRWSFIKRSPNTNETHRSFEITVKGQLYCPNGYVIRKAALSGSAIAYLPAYYVKEALDAGALVEIMPNWQPEPVDVSLVYPKTRFKVTRVSTLADFLISQHKHC